MREMTAGEGHRKLRWDFQREFGKNSPAIIAVIVLALIILSAILAPFLTDVDPSYIRLSDEYVRRAPSSRFPLGTDHLGRDLYSRMLFGARVSLTVGFLTMIISVGFGSLYGAIAGYFGGWLDWLMMRLADILLSLPALFILIILAHFTKPGIWGIALIIGLTGWMRPARLVRGQFLSLKEREYVEAARALGYSDQRIIFIHILPGAVAVIIVNATLMIAQSIITESALSFLGLGLVPPLFSWGSMLNAAQDIILLREAPWMALFPGMAIFITVLCFNHIGDSIQNALSPPKSGGKNLREEALYPRR